MENDFEFVQIPISGVGAFEETSSANLCTILIVDKIGSEFVDDVPPEMITYAPLYVGGRTLDPVL